MGKHQTAKTIMGSLEIALPSHQQDPRRVNLLARMQHQMRQFHAGGQPRVAWADPARRPTGRPTDGSEQSLARGGHVEERESPVR